MYTNQNYYVLRTQNSEGLKKFMFEVLIAMSSLSWLCGTNILVL